MMSSGKAGEAKSTWRSSPPVLARESCTVCHGTGWEIIRIGTAHCARRCSCGFLSRLLELRERVRIPHRYEKCSLDNFVPNNHSQAKALSEARKFAGSYPYVRRELFFAGGPGVGKTHLAVAIARNLLYCFHEDVLFVDFVTLMMSGLPYGQPSCSHGAEWGRLRKTSLLVLDNFGTLRPTETRVAAMQELLELRRESKKLTIYTGGGLRCRDLFQAERAGCASLTQQFLSAFPPFFLMSFLSGIRIVSMGGEDYRRRDSSRELLF